jgi:hypothetical protein
MSETREERQFRLDMEWLAGEPQGRRILYRLIVSTGCFEATPDPYAAGRQSVGKDYLRLLAFHFPPLLTSMLVENKLADDDHGSSARDGDEPGGGDPRFR